MSAVHFPDYRKLLNSWKTMTALYIFKKKKPNLKVTLSFKVKVKFCSSPIHKKSTSLLKRKAQLISAGHMQFDRKGKGSH